MNGQPAARPCAAGNYWTRPAVEVAALLHSSEAGLAQAEAAQRLSSCGPNLLKLRQRTTAWGLFLNQFRSPIILLLLFATALSALLREWVDSSIILVILAGSALLSMLQEYRASRMIEALQARISAQATVLRDGAPQTIPAAQVVPGDVVSLVAGSLIPADGLLLEARDLLVSQAVLTGETFPVAKQPGIAAAHAGLAGRNNCVFMGTSVRSGTGSALVVATGVTTEFGQIAGRLALRPPEAEFERGLRRFGYLLAEVTLLLVLAIFAVNVYFDEPVIESLLFALALAVGLTPQLLPAIVNINLAHGAQAMARAGVIVRRLAALENFGSMDLLCTDKTGTLTEGVVRLDGALDVTGQPSEAVFRLAYLNAALQSGLPNPLDEAITGARTLDLAGVRKVDEIPYDFTRKRLSVVVEEQGARCLITKGALENVLAACMHWQMGEQAQPLDDEMRRAALARLAEWSGSGFRVLGVATRQLTSPEMGGRAAEQALTFRGYLLFFDPPKQGVPEAIQDLAALGVHLKIITGDNRLVARHVAEQIGLPVTGVLTGEELDNLHDDALWYAAERTTIFAEVEPNQKERLILALKKTGHVVGYMGDGINDAPALHAADVSISVDQAVDVAKEAADFVLLERNLAVLHLGIIEGRRTFANTLKYIFITTSANFGNMFSMAGLSLFLPFLPLLPKQILLTNLLSDIPAMTSAADRVDREWIDKPRRWDIRMIRNFMVTFGLVSTCFDFLTFGVLLGLLRVTVDQFRTGWFLASVMTELSVMLILRTSGPFFRSRPGRWLLGSTLLVALVTVLLPYLPGQALLDFVPLPPSLVLALLLIALLYCVATELAKHFFYRRERASTSEEQHSPPPPAGDEATHAFLRN
jgi:P-type Mg2+ transporter